MTTRELLDIGAPRDKAELKVFRRLADNAFAPSPPLEVDIERPLQQGIENFRLARIDGRVAGGLGMLHMGQWFGGRSVPMTGINAVVVAPEYRSAGVASRLLGDMLVEVRAMGTPLSTLYPATQPVYRRAGYEQAGVLIQYRQPTHALDARDRDLSVRPMEAGEEGTLRELYAERARRTSGLLDRNEYMWARVLEARDTVKNIYLVERDGKPEGYVVYTKQQQGEHQSNIVAEDLVALSPSAARRLLSFLAGHRSVVDNVVWTGSPAEPLFLHLANQDYAVTYHEQWMLRVVDVRGALEARGYPEGLEAELHMDVRDEVLPGNSGKWVLEVSGGRGSVRQGGEGRVRADVRGLAAAYTGYLSPLELQVSGLIDGPERELRTMGMVFAGPAPWMADGF